MSATYAVPPLIPPNTNAQSGYVDLLEVGTLIVENLSTEGTINASSVTALSLAYTTKSTYNQATSNVTTVPITTSAGQVVTFGTFSSASASSTSFNLTGSVILATSQIMLQLVTYGGVPFTNGVPVLTVSVSGAGTAVVTVSNYGANALAGNVVFTYMIV